jgi:hypothetical protein
MGEAYGTYVGDRNTVICWESRREKLPNAPRNRWEYNIKTNLKETG